MKLIKKQYNCGDRNDSQAMIKTMNGFKAKINAAMFELRLKVLSHLVGLVQASAASTEKHKFLCGDDSKIRKSV